MNAFKRLIEGNRRAGTSTALIKTVKEVGGYLIVGNMNSKHDKLKINPELAPHIFTYYEVEQGKCLGVEPGPIFFDTDCVWQLITKKEKMEQKPEIIRESYLSDGYQLDINTALRNIELGLGLDGYKNSKQINVKLTEDDVGNIDNINRDFFENEASNSMMGRILLRKGIQFYKKLRDSF
jgi:hypothetical protein